MSLKLTLANIMNLRYIEQLMLFTMEGVSELESFAHAHFGTFHQPTLH